MADPRHGCSEKCTRKSADICSPKLRGVGPTDAKIMFIGEAPGQEEDRKGIPFIGASGEVLTDLFAEVGIDRDQVYITNAIKCATPDENQKPAKLEIALCREYLIAEINKIKPNVIGVIGNIALDAVLKRTGITKIQNNVLFSKEFNVKVVPVVHPAYVLRNPSAEADLKKGLEIIKRESTAHGEVKGAKDKVQTRHIDAKTPEQINAVLRALERADEFAFDLETTSLNPHDAKILLISFSWTIGLGVTIRWDRLTPQQLDRLQRILAAKGKLKVGHNLKFDIQVLLANGIRVKNPIFDCLPAIALLNENLRDKSLDTLTLRYLDMGEYWVDLEDFKKEDMKKNKINKDDYTYSRIPYSILSSYAQCDGDATFRLFIKFRKELLRQNLLDFYNTYTIPTLWVLLKMEYHGILVDRKKLKKLGKKYTAKVRNALAAIMENKEVGKYQKIRYMRASKMLEAKWEQSKTLRGRFPCASDYTKIRIKEDDWVFNPGSTKQLREIFFDMMGLETENKTGKGDYSTNEETLKLLASEDNVNLAKQIIEYRQLTKFLSTYIKSIYSKSKFDGRVHPGYMQHRTVTGRIASQNPNFQNIPRNAADLKECFLADPGMTIVKSDLAQAEFRCWAHYSEDAQMIADIEAGLDIHRKIAAEIFGTTEDAVTKEQRTAAKNCVSGDTWIPTSVGLRQINSINKGDIVLDHLNRRQTVLKTVTKLDNVYLVDTECGSIKCTANHPFYVIDVHGNVITKKLSELSNGDYILSCTPRNKQKKYITWSFVGDRRTSFKPIFRRWVLTPELGYLLGFILAEGSINTRTRHVYVRWCQKGKFVNMIDVLSKKIFGARVKRYIDKRNGLVTWAVTSLEFVEFLKYLGMTPGNKKGFKTFPDKIIMSPTDVQKAFLQGYFLGDGTFKWDRACAGTVCRDTCDALCLLLRGFGIYPKIAIEHPNHGRVFYNIQITNTDELALLVDTVGVHVPKGWAYPRQNRGRKFLHNVNQFYRTHHTNCDVRYGIKIRKKLTHSFLRKYCFGINSTIDTLVKNNIYSVKITAIKHIGKLPVYDFVTTGDKVMVANGFYTLDCVFGLMYGRGVKAIAKQYGITEDEAEAVRDLFFQKYPDASIWLDKQVQQAHEYKTVKTWMGRIRRLPEIDSYDKMVQAEAERQARNSPIQGLASDMNNHYMVMTLRLAKKEGITCYPMTTIHDANVIQVKKGQEESLINVMNKVVATAFPGFLCKMKLDFEIGTTLGTLEVVEL